MTSPDITSVVLAERRRDQRREADIARLAALLRCCRPSAWRSAVRRVRDVVTRTPQDAVSAC